MEICRWTLLIYADYCYFFQVETLVNSSFGNDYVWFVCDVFRMIKNVSANRFLSFAFEKYCLYNKHRKENSLNVFGRCLSR